MIDKIEDVLEMYDHCNSVLRGTYIIDYMNLTNTEQIEIFFRYFENVFEINPGSDLMSLDWIQNTYGLTKSYKREFNLNKILG
jgi:hypothetical protein